MRTHLWFAIGLVTGATCMLLVGKQFTFRIETVGNRTNAVTVNLQLPLKTSTATKGSN